MRKNGNTSSNNIRGGKRCQQGHFRSDPFSVIPHRDEEIHSMLLLTDLSLVLYVCVCVCTIYYPHIALLYMLNDNNATEEDSSTDELRGFPLNGICLYLIQQSLPRNCFPILWEILCEIWKFFLFFEAIQLKNILSAVARMRHFKGSCFWVINFEKLFLDLISILFTSLVSSSLTLLNRRIFVLKINYVRKGWISSTLLLLLLIIKFLKRRIFKKLFPINECVLFITSPKFASFSSF